MKILFLFLALLSTNLFGVDSSIYTWGYADIFSKVLNGVVIISQDDYIFKAAVGLGGFILVTKTVLSGASSSDMTLAIGKYLFMVTIIIGMFSENTKTYIIEDEITGETIPVNNVPIGIGETFSLFSGFERSLGKAFETAFATPNTLRYTEVGMGFSATGADALMKVAEIKNQYTVLNYNQYTENCILSALTEGTIRPDKFATSNDLMNDLEVQGYLSIWYDDAHPNGIDRQCQDVWNDLKNSLPQEIDLIAGKAAAKTYLSKQKFNDALPQMTQLLYGASKSAENYIQQQTLINMTAKSMNAAFIATGGDTANLAYNQTLAEKSQQATWQTAGVLAQKNLPLMKGIFTVLVLAIFILLAILSIIFGSLGYIKMGFTLLMAMLLWTPLAIIINSMLMNGLEQVMPVASDGSLTMVSKSFISEELKNYIAFTGYLASMIPILAYSVAKMSEHGFVSVFSGVSAAASSAASSAVGQSATGNISHGQANIGGFKAYDKAGSHEYYGAKSWGSNTI